MEGKGEGGSDGGVLYPIILVSVTNLQKLFTHAAKLLVAKIAKSIIHQLKALSIRQMFSSNKLCKYMMHCN